jgi:AAA+ ATPase superfamily predicted ATPase
MRKFFDRERQLEKLEALWRKDSSSFVVVAGGPAAWQMSGF